MHCPWSRLAAMLLPLAGGAVGGCHRAEPTPSPSASASAATADSGVPKAGGAHSPRTGAASSAGPTPSVAFNPPTPEPIAPPPLRTPPSTPNLPRLPAVAAYPKAQKPPSGPDLESCGQVWSGEEWMPVECIDPGERGHKARAAQVVVPYALMKGSTEKLPRIVDHRADATEGPVRKQTGPQCTAFAFTSALDHAYSRWTGQPGHFSVMQVWARYDVLHEHAAADDNAGTSIADESSWPYDGKVATSWMKCPAQPKPGQVCGKPIDSARLAQLDSQAIAEITQIEALSTTELDVVREKLAGGQDVTVAVRLPSFALAGEPGAKYVLGVPADGSTTPPKIGHEILLAGYAMLPVGNYYLIHNSWGPAWGDGGYAWIHEDILKRFWNDNLVVVPDVEPLAIARVRDRPHGGLTATCPSGQLPDSISGACVGACPDGSPRHNDACAAVGQCPDGTVNLTGACEMAAPAHSSGTEPSTHVRWSCGQGGCSYFVPAGTLGCSGGECAISCPAPEFRLAKTPKGLVCVE